MNASQDLDRQIRTWMTGMATDDAPADLLERSLGRVDATGQRPAWILADAWRNPGASRRTNTVRAGSLLVGAMVAVLAVGASLQGLRLPSILGQPSSSPLESAAPSDGPSSSPRPSSGPSPDPSGPLGGGLILVHDLESRVPGGGLGVYVLDAGTGEKTLLGTVPPVRQRPGRSNYAFQWAADRTHALIDGSSGGGPIRLTEPTRAADDLAFVCCVPDGEPDLSSWALSPSGDRLAGLHTSQIAAPGGQGTLGVEDAVVILDVASARIRTLNLPKGSQVGPEVSWSPDGSAVVVAGCRPCDDAPIGQTPTAIQHQRLFVVPVDGAPVRELMDETRSTFGSPAWSPDGATIAVAVEACPPGALPPNCLDGTSSIETVGIGQGGRVTLAEVSEAVSGPVWAPDGSRIAFSDNGGVFVVNADDRGLLRLADGSDPHWSPDGGWILYSTPAANDLWIIAADGGSAPRHLGPFGGGAW